MEIINVNLPTNGGFSRRAKTDMIVLHHAEAKSASVEEINRWHLERGWTGIGYHYYIRKDGKIYRGRPEWAIGAHAQGVNAHSIGVCCEGSYMTETMPEKQLDALCGLVRELLGKYPGAVLRRHKDVGSTDCPGVKFPWEEVQKRVSGKEEPKKEEKKVTYEEFAAFMKRYEEEKANQQAHPYAADAWKAMQDAGITDGSKPQCSLTREQFATMCQRMGLIGKGVK